MSPEGYAFALLGVAWMLLSPFVAYVRRRGRAPRRPGR